MKTPAFAPLIVALSLASVLGMAGLLQAQQEDSFADPPRRSSVDDDPFADRAPGSGGDDPFITNPHQSSSLIPSNEPIPNESLGIFYEFIEVDPVVFTEILSDDAIDLHDGEAVREAIETHLGTERASLVDSCWGVGVSRQKSKVESIREIIYPVEWEAGKLFPKAANSRLNQEPAEVIRGAGYPKVVDGVAYWPPAAFPQPTTFEMRPTGTTIEWEVEPLSDHPGVVKCSSAPERVRDEGESIHMSLPMGRERVAATRMPIFATARAASIFSEQIGKTRWVGTAGGSQGRPLLVFTRVNQLQRSAPVSDRPKKNRLGTTIVVEFIEVDAAWFSREMRGLGGGHLDSKRLRSDLQSMIRNDEASLVEVVSSSSLLGSQSQSEGIEEYIYPTEYRPGELPVLTVPTAADGSVWAPNAYPLPRAFQTRNTGATIKVTVGDRGGVPEYSLDVVAEIVRHAGNRVLHEFPTPSGKKPLCEAPVFTTLRVTTSVSVRSGEVVLIGGMTPQTRDGGDEMRRVLVFLKLVM